MLAEARQRLSRIQPISVTMSRVLYHPEAIMLGFAPEGALDPIHHAVRQATLAATGRTGGVTGPAGRWTPHMTISYSTGKQPMAPIVVALGHEVPRCDITVRAASLVIQWGPERLWNWQPVGMATLGPSRASRRSVPGSQLAQVPQGILYGAGRARRLAIPVPDRREARRRSRGREL